MEKNQKLLIGLPRSFSVSGCSEFGIQKQKKLNIEYRLTNVE